MKESAFQYLEEHGSISPEYLPIYLLENGVVKWKNRHLFKMAYGLSLGIKVPKHFWPKAVLIASYHISLVPSCALDFKMSYQFSIFEPQGSLNSMSTILANTSRAR